MQSSRRKAEGRWQSATFLLVKPLRHRPYSAKLAHVLIVPDPGHEMEHGLEGAMLRVVAGLELDFPPNRGDVGTSYLNHRQLIARRTAITG